MRGEPCSPVWRLCALLPGACWVVTLVVACGGGDDDAVAISVAKGATGVAGSGARAEAGAMVVTTRAPQTPAQTPGKAPGHGAAAVPSRLQQPCNDESRRLAQFAAVPTQLRATRLQGDGLNEKALNSPAGRPGSGAAGAETPADPFEAK